MILRLGLPKGRMESGVLSLLGDAGALITGTTIILDGGVVMAP